MITYYAYSVEYGQYLADPVKLNQEHLLQPHTDKDDFLTRATYPISTSTHPRAAFTLENWQKLISLFGLKIEKISPLKEKIIIEEKITEKNISVIKKKEKITSIPRAVIIDDSEEVSILHFEKKSIYDL